MDTGMSAKPESVSQGSADVAGALTPKSKSEKLPSTPTTSFQLKPSSKGVENAKKRLRAFSIQKKAPLTPIAGQIPKGISGGSATVIIGKFAGAKVIPKLEDVDQKKPPKPPKPGVVRRALQESYTDQQKRTLTEIEEMKRKMELVDLGIPLGLIYPTSSSDKAMPTKAMPPIKTFLDPAKLDEVINEAKKAKAEGKTFKFDYNKLLPDYDNPFQRKKEEPVVEKKKSEDRDQKPIEKTKESRKYDRYDSDWRYSGSYKKDDRDSRRNEKDRKRNTPKDKDVRRDKKEKKGCEKSDKDIKETDVDLNDYLVCDSWSLENEDKTNSSSPKVDDKIKQKEKKTEDVKTVDKTESPADKPIKIQRLQPVIDSFKFELDEDDYLDIFDENTELQKFTKKTPKKDDMYDSPVDMRFLDGDATKDSSDALSLTDDTFLESVINEIKLEAMSDEESQDKGLVEYDSPIKDEDYSPSERLSVTPELDDRMRCLQSSRSDYSDGYRSTESGYKSTESGCRSTESEYKSTERVYQSTGSPSEAGYGTSETDYKPRGEYKESLSEYNASGADYNTRESEYKTSESEYSASASVCKSGSSGKSLEKRSDSYRMSVEVQSQMQKITMDSLETWSFVMKICQPLLFRHDRNKCYKETRVTPKLWYTENPKVCNCVKDRSIVYEELEMCKMALVDRVYGCDQIPCVVSPKARTWYPRLAQCLTEPMGMQQLSSDWEADDSQTETASKDKRRSATPQRSDEIYLDREYQRFMEAVWPEVSEAKSATPRSTTPVKQEARKKKKVEEEKETDDKRKAKKIKLSSEGWSQESDVEEVEKSKKTKMDKEKSRKRKHSSSLSDSESDAKKKKKALKKKANKKGKTKESKRKLKSRLKKLKEKQKKKLLKVESEEDDRETKKKEKSKKRKLQKKKKALKRKKSKPQSSSSSSSSSSTSLDSSDSEEEKRKRKKREAKKKKRKQSTSDSTQSEELFDVNILNNIKTERLTDDEKNQAMGFSPRRKPREIINVKELQNDFVGNNIHIKQEAVEVSPEKIAEELEEEKERENTENIEQQNLDDIVLPEAENKDVPEIKEETDLKEPQVPPQSPTQPRPDDASHSQSSQESALSKDQPPYEKDDSHLRPSSQNSNYSFNDVINASNPYKDEEEPEETELHENYEQGNYEMYEQLAMAYQSDVAKLPPTNQPEAEWWGGGGAGAGSQRIETVLGGRRGEIKCDWRAGDQPAAGGAERSRPSRWGLKPGEVNIVLTGGGSEQFPIPSIAQPVYQIQSIANRSDNNSTGYDEAYEDMYGASDRLQYGDCFGDAPPPHAPAPGAPDPTPASASTTTSLDDRINRVLRDTVLGDVAKEVDDTETDKDGDSGARNTKSSRNVKRVSFADGYKPGQDSDVEEPPLRKKRRSRRVGCAWPCPATHRDHVPLWDALPPPPPPPGSPPPLADPAQAPAPGPPAWARPPPQRLLPAPPYPTPQKMDPSVLPNFMPPEPPPGLISF